MAEPDFEIDSTPTLQQLATFFVDELTDPARLARLQAAMRNAHAEGETVAAGARMKAAPELGAALEHAWEDSKDVAQRALGAALGWLVGEILGIEVSAGDLFKARQNPEESAVGAAIASVAFKAIRGDGDELAPSDAAARRLLGTLAHIITHCWAEGIVLEKVEGYTSWSGHIEAITELAKDLVDTLGLSRAARMAIRPLVRAVVQVPHEWKVNKTFRPNLLSEGEIVRAFQRGDYSGDEAAEELARLGYSDRRQELLLKSAAKKLSLDELLQLWRHGDFEIDFVRAALREQGYDETTAVMAIRAANTKRTDAQYDNSIATLTRAFVNREIEEKDLVPYLEGIIFDAFERGAFVTAAQTERALNVRHLSHAEVIDCVELGILPTSFYRSWLAREGYPEAEGFALELRLRMRIDKETASDVQRAKLAAERAAEKQARDDAAAARQAAIAAERALHRRGALADLNRAAVRGLIPFARVAEVLAAEYDADTVDFLLKSLEIDRAAYVEQQQRADDARKRAGVRNLDVGAIEAAVLAGVLTLDEFDARLKQLGFSAEDSQVLRATLAARQKDLADAKATHARAEAAAKIKTIDLGRFEQLVRRGVRTFAAYDALLKSLGFDDGARAAMIELLRLKVADDAAAETLRAKPTTARDAGGLTFDELRRAVVLGLAPIDRFASFLVEQRYTSDAQALLLAELRDDLAAADDARRRRADADARRNVVALSLDKLARAVRLGIVSPAAYADRLAREGYSDDDTAIELALLTTEIADVQATRARRDAAAPAGGDRGLTLAQVAAAVKVGAATIDDYIARGRAIGYNDADLGLLVAVLNDELAVAADARDRRVTINGELAARTLSLGQLEAAVKAGVVTVAGYVEQLIAWGYGADDAELLAGLLGADKTGAQ